MERGSGSEGRRRGGGQHMKCADREMEELTEDKQTPCSHLVRHLRQAQSANPSSPYFSASATDRVPRSGSVCFFDGFPKNSASALTGRQVHNSRRIADGVHSHRAPTLGPVHRTVPRDAESRELERGSADCTSPSG